jgi:hypothetical protein
VIGGRLGDPRARLARFLSVREGLLPVGVEFLEQRVDELIGRRFNHANAVYPTRAARTVQK